MPNLKTVDEIAPLLRSSTTTIRRLIHKGELPYTKIGKKFLFTDDHISMFLTRNVGNVQKEV